MSSAIAPEIIEAAKARYAILKETGQTEGAFEARRDAAPRLPETVAAERIVAEDSVPGGRYWHGIVRTGEVLRVENPAGNAGVPLILWSAADPSERLNPPDTVKVQWTAAIGRGRVLLSDMGRAMAAIVDGPDGGIDCIAGISSAAGNAARGLDAATPNARDHFLRAAAKHGLGKRDIGPAVTLFAPVLVAEGGDLVFDGEADRTGRYDIRAEMDLIVALANCPHPLSPAMPDEAATIGVTLWRPDPPGADDLCRTATEEAVRAYENTDTMHTGGRP